MTSVINTMKKLLFTLCIIMLASTAYGRGITTTMCGGSGAGAAPPCTYTSKNAQTGTGASYAFNFAGGRNGAFSFAANGTYSPRRITVSLKKTGSPTATISFRIYQDAGESTSRTAPKTAALITPAATLSSGDFTTDYANYTIEITELETAELTNANIYWLDIVGTTSSSNYISWQYSSSGSEEMDYEDEPVVTWVQNDTSTTGNFTIWSCE